MRVDCIFFNVLCLFVFNVFLIIKFICGCFLMVVCLILFCYIVFLVIKVFSLGWFFRVMVIVLFRLIIWCDDCICCWDFELVKEGVDIVKLSFVVIVILIVKNW